jgi:RNA polymerase sigma-70 factor (ECF subfamily)
MITCAQVEELYRRCGHAVFVRCLKLVGNEDEARDLTQETFFQFCRSKDRFEGRSSPFTFLYRIATNVSVDRLRRRKTAGEQLSTSALAEAPGTKVAMEAEQRLSHVHDPASFDTMGTLARLTAGLDDETLTIAVMSHVDGLTQDEIAEALELSRRTVGKKLKRFLEHTRARAEAEGTQWAGGTGDGSGEQDSRGAHG